MCVFIGGYHNTILESEDSRATITVNKVLQSLEESFIEAQTLFELGNVWTQTHVTLTSDHYFSRFIMVEKKQQTARDKGFSSADVIIETSVKTLCNDHLKTEYSQKKKRNS